MILTLRTLGMLHLLKSNPNLSDFNDICSLVADSPKYVAHTIQELQDMGVLSRIGDTIHMPQKDITPGSLESRIYDMFYQSKTYEVIAWFLAQLDKTFELDSELRERVLLEYDAASVVRFWDSYNIEQALKRALVDKSVGNVTLDDLRQLLVKRDKGELVWQK